MGQSETARTSRAWQATCLVVGPQDTTGSLDLLIGSLSKRGLSVQRCDNAHAAMAEALLRKEPRGGRPSEEPLVFVLVEPDRCPRSSELHAAAGRHVPNAVFWEYQSRPAERLTTYQPRLAPVTPPPGHPPGPVPVPIVARGVPTGSPAAEVRPTLRLAGEDDSAVGLGTRRESQERMQGVEPAKPDPGHARLTEEELEMLLGAGPEGDPTGGGAIDR